MSFLFSSSSGEAKQSTTSDSVAVRPMVRKRLLGVDPLTGKRKVLAKPLRKGLVDKDKVFSVTATEPFIGRHLSDNALFRCTRIKRYDGFLVSSTLTDTTGSLQFTLGDLPGTTDVTSLFDVYRIVAIEVWIIPRFSTNTDRSFNPGLLGTAVDYDGGTANYDELAQYPNAMISSGLDGHYRSWAPGVLTTTAASNVILTTSPWIDCANTSIAHHGLNYAINTTSLALTFDRIDRYHLEFKRVR